MFRIGIMSCAIALLLIGPSQGNDGYGDVDGGYQIVPKTVMVPSTVWVRQTVTRVRYRPECRERMVEKPVQVAVPTQVEEVVTIMTAEDTMRQQEYTEPTLYVDNRVQELTVMMPRRITVRGFRDVPRRVSTTVYKTVCDDAGEWAVDESGCRQWVPKLVYREVPTTEYQTVIDKVPYEFTQTVSRPEVQPLPVQLGLYEEEMRTRSVRSTRYRPVEATVTVNKTQYKTVLVTKKEQYTVMIPEPYEAIVCVPERRLVAKTILQRIPLEEAADDGSH